MIEVEIKISVKDRGELEQNLEKRGFQKGNLVKETDLYFDKKGESFRKSDEALRIRQWDNLTLNESRAYLTYKGPKLDSISMTRKELEVQIENAKTGKEILTHLNFLPVQPVIKLRQYFHKDKMVACLDQVEGLGDYLELEIILSGEDEREPALEQMIALLEQLGYCKEDIIRTSYLSMLQKKL